MALADPPRRRIAGGYRFRAANAATQAAVEQLRLYLYSTPIEPWADEIENLSGLDPFEDLLSEAEEYQMDSGIKLSPHPIEIGPDDLAAIAIAA